MTSITDLDDPNHLCVGLPPRESGEVAYPSPYPTRDIPGGYDVRLATYRELWNKCLRRVQSIVHELHRPILSSTISDIQDAYSEVSNPPTLVYPELPVFALSAAGGATHFLNNIYAAFEDASSRRTNPSPWKGKGKGRADEDTEESLDTHSATKQKAIFLSLNPQDCVNLTSAMKSLITGFVDRSGRSGDDSDDDDVPKGIRRKPTASLSNYDINLLEAWYTSLRQDQDLPPLLIVVWHHFEQLDPVVLRDVFYICSQHVASLPLIFFLELSSATQPSYLHKAYPRSTLAVLRLHTVILPSGSEMIEHILAKTFFDVDFDPGIMLGPATLDYLVDFTTRHSCSVDAFLTIVQLAYMKHFEEPLTLFVNDNLLGSSSEVDADKVLEDPYSYNFLDSLLTRIWNDASKSSITSEPSETTRINIDWRSPTVSNILDSISTARSVSRKRVQNLRIGFQTFRLVQSFIRAQGFSVSHSAGSGKEEAMGMMKAVARGRVGKDVRYLGLVVKKLNATQLQALLSQLHGFLQSLQSYELWLGEERSREHIMNAIAEIPEEAIEQEGLEETNRIHPGVPPIAASLSEWMIEFIESRISRLDQGILWDVWNTGMTPFPSELLNPAPRLAVVNALLHPHHVIQVHQGLANGGIPKQPNGHIDPLSSEDKEPELWEFPDTSILFRRYMDAGKMINVFDWYESFAVVLDTQRRNREMQKAGDVSSSSRPTTPTRKGKNKASAVEQEDVVEAEEDEEEEEKWRIEVQARFIRAMHELDYMGFIKHTGRKQDHVLKTIYDIPD